MPLVDPRYTSAPASVATLGDEVADLNAEAGFPPDPEQRLGLDMIFALNPHGRCAAFEFCVICARQNLKTGLFKQACLGWLFLTKERLVVWSAHEFKTSREAMRDMVELIEANAFLTRRLKKIYSGAGDESIELMSGARLIFKARTTSGGRGLSGDKVVLDEAFALRPSHMGALLPTLSVRPDPQVVYGSSACLAESDVLRAIRDRGRGNLSERLAYLEWCAERGGCVRDHCDHEVGVEGCALDKVENWRQANPLLGRRRANGTGLTIEYVAAERQALPPAEFARERMGWHDEPGAAEIFGAGKWEGCAGQRPDGLKVQAIGVAISFDLAYASIVAAAQHADRTVIAPLYTGPNTPSLLTLARDLSRIHKVPAIIDGRGPAASLIPHLQASRTQVHMATTGEVLDAAAKMFDLVVQGKLLHTDNAEINTAVNGATTRPVGDRWTWARRLSSADISPLEAATLAAWWVSRPRPQIGQQQLPRQIEQDGPVSEVQRQGF